MTATFAKSAKPSYAVTCWADDNNVFVELPCDNAPPYIITFALTSDGLGKALSVMRELYVRELPIRRGGKEPANYTRSDSHPKLVKPSVTATESQRESARAVLRKLGII